MKKILMFFVSLTMCLGFIVYEENTVQAIDDGYKYHSDFPVYLTFSNDTTYRNNLLLKGECVYITSGNISGSYYPIDIITDTLNPGTYVITCDMIGFESDEFLYENGGNIYDAQNDIILPTTWTVNDRTYSAEFTVTKSTNRLTLGENSTYIQVTEPVYYNREVMMVSLNRKIKDFKVDLAFSNDTTYRNNLLLKGNSIYVTSGNISSSYYPIDIITDTLNPGTYVISCDMIGFESDKFLYENGGNIYDAQNDIILPTTWTVNDRTYSAEFTVTKSTNRLTLGENSTYIQVTEPVYYNRLVMTVSLTKYVNKIPLEFSFQTETYPSPLIFNGDKIMLPANQSYESSNPIDLNTISLSPGNYRLTVVLNGLPSDVFAYPMCGNIYDQKNHISLPTEWSGKERMSIAEFTITAATNKLTLGEQGTYISAMETSPIKRDIMTVSLEKIE